MLRGKTIALSFLLLCLFNEYRLFVGGEHDNFETDSVQLKTKQRFKRQDPSDQFIDNIFQIPISTLSAVNNLIKSTRPMIQRARERIQQQYSAWQQQQQPQQRPNRSTAKP